VYIPSYFAETRADVLAEFIRHYSFGTLVTVDSQAELCSSHLPFLLQTGGSAGYGTLITHVAKQNDQWKSLRPDVDVLAIFQGPHAYVSPRFYVTKLAVPTWNYAAVHVYGRPRLIEDAAQVRQVLADTVTAYEGMRMDAWSLSDLPDGFVDKMSHSIVAFAIDITRIEGKFKLNQNRSREDRDGVISALMNSADTDAREIARLMRDVR
jgi:transcriptional regulator